MRSAAIVLFFLLLYSCTATHPQPPPVPPDAGNNNAASDSSLPEANAFQQGLTDFEQNHAGLAAASGADTPSDQFATPGESPASRKPLTLDAAIETAVANNPEVAAAKWDAAAASARKDRAAGQRLPDIGLSGDYTRRLGRERVMPTSREGEPGAFSRSVASAEVVLSVPVYTGGRLSSEMQAARLLREEAMRRHARTRQALVFDVSSVFFQILAQRSVIESLELSIKAIEEHLRQTEERIAAKKAAPVDRMRTEVRMAELRQDFVREKNLLSIQHRILANLMGLPGRAGRIEPAGDLEEKTSYDFPDADVALETAKQKRQDFLAARAAAVARELKIDAAKGARWPAISLEGAYGGRRALGSVIGPGDDSGDMGRVGVAMEMPLFQGGAIDASIRENRAEYEAARQRLRALEHRIALEVETATLDVQAASKQVQAGKTTVALARETLRIEQEKYAAGTAAVADVLDAQAALLDAEKTYYRAMAEFRTAVARLHLAVGEL